MAVQNEVKKAVKSVPPKVRNQKLEVVNVIRKSELGDVKDVSYIKLKLKMYLPMDKRRYVKISKT